MEVKVTEVAWLARFHAGDRDVMEAVYRDHFVRVRAVAARVLSEVDAETVAHEVFERLLSDERSRRSFEGGNLGAWIAQVAHNRSLDVLRRRRRELSEHESPEEDVDPARLEDELEAKRLVDRFLRERLPGKYRSLFDARFLRQLSQREAAQELGIERSTLAYQEKQVRTLLTAFLLGEGES